MHFSAEGEEISVGFGEESETTEREGECVCETTESVKEDKSGGEGNLWCVRGNNAASRAPSPGVHAKPPFTLPRRWPRGNARIGGICWACVRGALTRVWAKI
jgi:hypothetical protein